MFLTTGRKPLVKADRPSQNFRWGFCEYSLFLGVKRPNSQVIRAKSGLTRTDAVAYVGLRKSARIDSMVAVRQTQQRGQVSLPPGNFVSSGIRRALADLELSALRRSHLVRYEAERVRQGIAQRTHRRNRSHTDQRGHQAIFNRRRTGFIFQNSIEQRHGKPPESREGDRGKPVKFGLIVFKLWNGGANVDYGNHMSSADSNYNSCR